MDDEVIDYYYITRTSTFLSIYIYKLKFYFTTHKREYNASKQSGKEDNLKNTGFETTVAV